MILRNRLADSQMLNGISFSCYMPNWMLDKIEDFEVERNSRKVRPRATRASIIREAVELFFASQNETRCTEATKEDR